MTTVLASQFLATRLRRLDSSLPKESRRVLTAADDEAVHDLRVTIRKLRIVMKLARPVFGRFHADAVRAAFAAAQSATGNLRDEEALEETLEALKITDASFETWLTSRRARRRTLHRAVVTTLQQGDFRRARRLLAALLVLPAEPNKSSDLARFAQKCVNDARKFVDRHRHAESTDVEALHELRIAYKGLRYTVETFADVLPADLKALREPAVKMQKLLGDVHDVDVALGIVASATGLSEPLKNRMHTALDARRTAKIAEFAAAMHPEPPAEDAAATPARRVAKPATPKVLKLPRDAKRAKVVKRAKPGPRAAKRVSKKRT
ncbi:MAG: CHAD domain-containing protein [Polyangiaceae bacterium]